MPPVIKPRPLTPEERWTFCSIALLLLTLALSACGTNKAQPQPAGAQTAQRVLPAEETLTIQRVTLDLTSACRVSAGVSRGEGRILVKFYGRDQIYVFDVNDRWLLAQREDRVSLKAVGLDAAGRPIYRAEIEYER